MPQAASAEPRCALRAGFPWRALNLKPHLVRRSAWENTFLFTVQHMCGGEGLHEGEGLHAYRAVGRSAIALDQRRGGSPNDTLTLDWMSSIGRSEWISRCIHLDFSMLKAYVMWSKAHLSCRLLEHNKQRRASAYCCFNERFNYIIGEKSRHFLII